MLDILLALVYLSLAVLLFTAAVHLVKHIYKVKFVYKRRPSMVIDPETGLVR